MYHFIFTKTWEKELWKLDPKEQERVLSKLKFLKENTNDYSFKKLTDMLPATHRVRIWNIRVILQKIDEDTFHILDIWYRWDIYK
jgi:mRNA-degrading endonuclease RelE of RelBE toxin-antitoxin system